MKRLVAGGAVLGCLAVLMSGTPVSASGGSGQTLFNQHCAACHPSGGNIINPQKTLSRKDREANKIKTEQDIIKTMRNPGPGMSKFDKNLISDKQAHEIAEYIIKTFK